MSDTKDLLDLCRLNLMEEHIEDSLAPDADTTKRAIDLKKRELITHIQNDPSPIIETIEAKEHHDESNNRH